MRQIKYDYLVKRPNGHTFHETFAIEQIEHGDAALFLNVNYAGQNEVHRREWTGLKDKNGREIYESDTVKTTNGNVATVKWNERTTGFILTPNPTRMLRDELALGLMVTQIEVIGNIYETAEVTETP